MRPVCLQKFILLQLSREGGIMVRAVEGGVLLNSDIDGIYHEFLCHSEKAIEVTSDNADEEQTIDINGLQELLGDRPWQNTSALYTNSTTTRKEGVSLQEHSADQKTRAYPL